MQGSNQWGPNAPPPQGQPSMPPARRGSSMGCIVASSVGLAVFLAVMAVIGKSAVERYEERSREAAAARRAAADEDDSRPARPSSPSASASPSTSTVPGLGNPVTIDLGAEGRVTLPSGSTLVKQTPLQPNLDLAVAYELGGDRLLIVTMTKPAEGACSMKLDREAAMAKDAEKEPNFDKLFRMHVHDRRKVGSTEGVYTEMDNRSPTEAKADAPFHAGAGYLVCTPHALLSLTMARRSGALTEEDRSQLTGIAASVSPLRARE